MTKILSRREAAERACISLRHFERLVEVGEGPALIRLGIRRVGIAEADFEAWIASRRHPAPGGKAV